jgi:cytochrome oxidase Cu insertion factor (SCO1/SenC/PrrC family)
LFPALALLGALALVVALLPGGHGGHRAQGGTSSGAGATAGGFDGATLPPGKLAPGFTLRDQSGRSVSLRSLRGRPLVLAFLYPGCGASCVLIAEQIRGALNDLPRAVPVVVVSARPRADSPAATRSFLAHVSLAGRALYLTGAPASVAAVLRAYGVTSPSAGAKRFGEDAEVRLLDAAGKERVVYGIEQLSPEALAHDIRRLEQEQLEGG